MRSSDFTLWKSMALSVVLHLIFFSFLAIKTQRHQIRYWVTTPVELVNIPSTQDKRETASHKEQVEKKVEEPKKKEKKEKPKSKPAEKESIKIKPKEEKKPKQEERVSPAAKPKEENPSPVPAAEPKESPSQTSVQSTIVPDVIDFPYLYYLNIIQKKVDRNLPKIDKPVTKKTIIYFKIFRNGQVQEAFVEQSCGSDAVDQLALAAVLRSGPFPELPREYKEDSLKVHFHFTFK